MGRGFVSVIIGRIFSKSYKKRVIVFLSIEGCFREGLRVFGYLFVLLGLFRSVDMLGVVYC